MSQIQIPQGVNYILETLIQMGYEAYVVGGCVRDTLMGRKPQDWDVCTSANPQEIKEVFGEYNIIETGIKHGTVTVIYQEEAVEVTTFRIDGEYIDSRHPTQVTFTNRIEEDLKRRDFTMNAVAYNSFEGFVDPFDGKKDIERKLIKCVGDGNKRFEEDGLRVLRGVRFAATFGFEIEKDTEKSLARNKNRIRSLSAERVNGELVKIILGDFVVRILAEYPWIIEETIPELLDFSWEDSLGEIGKAAKKLEVRLALLLKMLDVKKAKEVLKRLKFTAKTTNQVIQLISLWNITIEPDPVAIKKLLRQWGSETLSLLIEAKKAQALAGKGSVSKIVEAEKIMDTIKKENQCFSIDTLEITGENLIEMGMTEGKKVGIILDMLLNKVIEGELPNKKESLIAYSAMLLNKSNKK